MNDLWKRPIFPVSAAPFDHVLVDQFLPQEMFAELAASFPECPAATGPTGFTIHPGDATFDRLMQTNDQWRNFWHACDSSTFVDFMLRQFHDCFVRDAAVDLSEARHVFYQETRADKERRYLTRVEHSANELWVRFDLMQGRIGYKRNVHVDHRRRAATMLLYFGDAEDRGEGGGDLFLHGTGNIVKRITPHANRAVMFPCHNSSWHSVSPIVSQQQPRNFLQITLSSSVDLWPPQAQSPRAKLRAAVRSLFGGNL